MTQLMVLDICLEARGNLFLYTSHGESRQLAYVLFHQVSPGEYLPKWLLQIESPTSRLNFTLCVAVPSRSEAVRLQLQAHPERGFNIQGTQIDPRYLVCR